MSEEQTLSQLINQEYNAWSDSINGKTIEDLGGTNAVLIMVINEITNKIYPLMYTQAVQFESFLSIYDANSAIIDNKFTTFKETLTALTESLKQQNTNLSESVNKSLQALNKQITNQNRVLDKQVIKLSKSISKITGER